MPANGAATTSHLFGQRLDSSAAQCRLYVVSAELPGLRARVRVRDPPCFIWSCAAEVESAMPGVSIDMVAVALKARWPARGSQKRAYGLRSYV